MRRVTHGRFRMADINVCTFTGRLTADAEQKTLPSGKTLVNFSIATNTGYGDNEKVLFTQVNLWGAQGDKLIKYLVKGKQVGVSGEYECQKWTSSDGKEHSKNCLNTFSIILFGGNSTTQIMPRTDVVKGAEYAEDIKEVQFL